MSLRAPARVVLYGAPGCPACREVRWKLMGAGWAFEVAEVDIDNGATYTLTPGAPANAALKAKLPGWSGYVPVLEIDGLVVELGLGELWRAFAPWPLEKEAVCV